MSQNVNWNNSYEQSPNLDTAGFLLPSSVTTTRFNIRRIVGKEHSFEVPSNEGSPGDVYVLQGNHKEGSARAYIGDDEPLVRPDGMMLDDDGADDDGRLWVDETGGVANLRFRKKGSWLAVGLGLTGVISHFPRNTTPGAGSQVEKGWLLCDGSKITNDFGGNGVYNNPALTALVRYLAGSNVATEAWLPRMTDGGGRFIKSVASGGEEAATGVGHVTPKLLDESVGKHVHTMLSPKQPSTEESGTVQDEYWKNRDVEYITLDDDEDYDGSHVHKINTGKASTAGDFTRLSGDNSSGGFRISDSGSEHQHKIKVDPYNDFEHTHEVEENVPDDGENRPPAICLYPFIHI